MEKTIAEMMRDILSYYYSKDLEKHLNGPDWDAGYPEFGDEWIKAKYDVISKLMPKHKTSENETRKVTIEELGNRVQKIEERIGKMQRAIEKLDSRTFGSVLIGKSSAL